ncbi:alpha/beta hydrolase [Streptosporangium sp. OZ121]|uniref:alpha/beta hydrolase n=1 Tax=Streptosporangium sp. OZ121 TaxID=3444183 RepID=UPI003F7955D3
MSTPKGTTSRIAGVTFEQRYKAWQARVAVSALVAGALVTGSTQVQAESIPSEHPRVISSDIPALFAEQELVWEPCDDSAVLDQGPRQAVLECSKFRTPRDWDAPSASPTLTIAVSRLRPEGHAPRGTLFVNPGGPGGPGVEFPLFFQQKSGDKLLDNMEIIGFDVRGVGRSTNVTCAGQGGIREDLDPRDRSAANLDRLLAASAHIAASCQSASGELGRYVNTKQTVFDLDLLRHLLGRDKIHWFGYSAGTWLGAYYATYFPSRVGRFVFDSNMDFTDTMQRHFLSQPMGFERRFRADFLPWVARHDDVYHLGATGGAVHRSYERLRELLAEEPLDLGDGRLIHPNTLDYVLIYGAMYSKDSFPAMAEALVSFLDMASARKEEVKTANARAADRKLKSAIAASPHMPLASADDSFLSTYWTVSCNDTPWTRGRDFVVEESARQGRLYPLAGWNTVSDPLACSSWNRPALSMPVPNGVGVPPVLMVQSEHDPATPIEGARRAHQRFAGSRMVTVTGEGDHGIYAHDNKCVDTIVEGYLVDGVLPTVDKSCPGLPLPEPANGTRTG